jgi:cytochrome c-type biogenesis protein CcmH
MRALSAAPADASFSPLSGRGCKQALGRLAATVLRSARRIMGSRAKPGHETVPERSMVAPAVFCSLLLLGAFAAFAVEPNERLADPALEARARTISGELRCLVCQNESIDESGADLAHDIRIFVRQRLTDGDTDAQAIQAVVTRYGQFVLLKPPVEPATYVLWYGPPLLVAVGLAGSLLWLRRRQAVSADAAPLSSEEARRLDGLMRETDV